MYTYIQDWHEIRPIGFASRLGSRERERDCCYIYSPLFIFLSRWKRDIGHIALALSAGIWNEARARKSRFETGFQVYTYIVQYSSRTYTRLSYYMRYYCATVYKKKSVGCESSRRLRITVAAFFGETLLQLSFVMQLGYAVCIYTAREKLMWVCMYVCIRARECLSFMLRAAWFTAGTVWDAARWVLEDLCS